MVNQNRDPYAALGKVEQHIGEEAYEQIPPINQNPVHSVQGGVRMRSSVALESFREANLNPGTTFEEWVAQRQLSLY